MTNTQLGELLLVRLYDLAESSGHARYHSLNEIATEFGVTDRAKVFNLAKALEGRGLIQAAFVMGPAVSAYISGEGSLFVEQGGKTGVISEYREHPGSFVAIDRSTHFHAPVTGSNVAVDSPGAVQSIQAAADILPVLAAIEDTIRATPAMAERSRAEALGDVTILRTELAREQPRRSIIAATLSTLGDLSSIASLVMQLQPLLQPWLGG